MNFEAIHSNIVFDSSSYLLVLDIALFVLVVGLLFINSIMSGFEAAFFSINKQDLQEAYKQSDSKSNRIAKLVQDVENMSSTILVSNNLFNVVIIVLSIFLSLQFIYDKYLILLIVFFIGIIIVLFVDILPKSYASQKPLYFIRKYIGLVYIINRIMSPLSFVLTRMIKIFNRTSIEKKYDISLDELSKALELTSDDTADRDNELEMLEGIIRFRNKTAEDIMVSRSDIVTLDIETKFTDVITYIVSAGFSRIPVYEENPDNIKGVLYVKDLLPNLGKTENFRWQSLIRPAYFVPGTKRIDDLLEEFRANKNHMAILIDEYGGTMGIVTMEDILEEIVGDISDEYDEDEMPLYHIAADGSYIFEGKTSLEDFIEITGVPEKDFEKIMEEVDTIAGLMLELKGDFPKRKEIIHYNNYSFQAEDFNNRRILKVRFLPFKSNK